MSLLSAADMSGYTAGHFPPMPPSPPPALVVPRVPKNIFMFWDSGTPPDFIAACISQIAKVNPGWLVYVMTPSDPLSISGVSDAFPGGNGPSDVAHTADWYRASTLAKHGGVWIDASSIALRPFTSWVDLESPDVQGFAAPWSNNTMENWAVRAPLARRLQHTRRRRGKVY